MAFDACMLCAIRRELEHTVLGGRVEKVLQPEKEELHFLLHRDRQNYRLMLNAGGSTPRICLTTLIKENPMTAPMFCMQLRKHLTGSKMVEIEQPGFERMLIFTFDCYDEMGFPARRKLICEIMGKYSNVIFCDEDFRILGVLRPVDFSTSQKRQVLPGMTYRFPPSQDKQNPEEAQKDDFLAAFPNGELGFSPEKVICSRYRGIATLNAREIVSRSVSKTAISLWESFSAFLSDIKENRFSPTLIRDRDGRPYEYSCFSLFASPLEGEQIPYDSPSALFDDFCSERDRVDKIKQRAADLFHLISTSQARLNKKISLQRADLATCEDAGRFRTLGELITSNLYQIRPGDTEVSLIDYYQEDMPTIEVKLNPRLTPSQNAQAYFKKYTKSQKACVELKRQIEIATDELNYLDSVHDALTRADGERELTEIRTELSQAGYGARKKGNSKVKIPPSKPIRFRTDGGFTVLCGRNNLQNDRLTFHDASRFDYWFHVKNAPGSHVILVTDGKEPDNESMTQAAIIAATQSSLNGSDKIPVDYTLIKNLKKPPASRPGFVTYSTNFTAYVIPDAALTERLKEKKQ